jgi:hypothetical protein
MPAVDAARVKKEGSGTVPAKKLLSVIHVLERHSAVVLQELLPYSLNA